MNVNVHELTAYHLTFTAGVLGPGTELQDLYVFKEKFDQWAYQNTIDFYFIRELEGKIINPYNMISARWGATTLHRLHFGTSSCLLS